MQVEQHGAERLQRVSVALAPRRDRPQTPELLGEAPDLGLIGGLWTVAMVVKGEERAAFVLGPEVRPMSSRPPT